MLAVGFREYGGPELIEAVEIADPKPGVRQVSVRVHSTVVNPGDTQFRRGDYAAFVGDAEPPYVPGMEFVGSVDAVGEGVIGLPVGTPVAGTAHFIPTGRGSHAEFVVTQATAVAQLPGNEIRSELATIPMNGLTARVVLDTLGLPEGAEVLVTGAAGAVGGLITELGSREGVRVTAVARPSDEDLLRSMGAVAFVPGGEDLVERLRADHPEGFPAVVDAAMLAGSVLPATADGGHFITLRPGHVPVEERGITAQLVSFRRYQDCRVVLEQLLAMAARGEITPRVAHELPPEQGEEAHRLVEAAGLRGRVLLTFV